MPVSVPKVVYARLGTMVGIPVSVPWWVSLCRYPGGCYIPGLYHGGCYIPGLYHGGYTSLGTMVGILASVLWWVYTSLGIWWVYTSLGIHPTIHPWVHHSPTVMAAVHLPGTQQEPRYRAKTGGCRTNSY